MTQQIICVTGMPGAGKTSVALALKDMLHGFIRISTGDAARAAAKEDAETAKALASGRMAPDTVIRDWIRPYLLGEHGRHVIVDGFPRYEDQIYQAIDDTGNRVFFIAVVADARTCERRMLSRGREGETEEHVRARLGLYYQTTSKAIACAFMLGLPMLVVWSGPKPAEIARGVVPYITEWQRQLLVRPSL